LLQPADEFPLKPQVWHLGDQATSITRLGGRVMSAFGTKRTCSRLPAMSAFGGIVLQNSDVFANGVSTVFLPRLFRCPDEGSCGIDASVPTSDAAVMLDRPPPMAVDGKET
jgi:hypothetical protein